MSFVTASIWMIKSYFTLCTDDTAVFWANFHKDVMTAKLAIAKQDPTQLSLEMSFRGSFFIVKAPCSLTDVAISKLLFIHFLVTPDALLVISIFDTRWQLCQIGWKYISFMALDLWRFVKKGGVVSYTPHLWWKSPVLFVEITILVLSHACGNFY